MAYYKPQKIVGYMPNKLHKDDEQWIHTKLSPLHPDLRYNVCRAYDKVFEETKESEQLSHRKIGKARYAANNRLRIFIEKRFAVFNK